MQWRRRIAIGIGKNGTTSSPDAFVMIEFILTIAEDFFFFIPENMKGICTLNQTNCCGSAKFNE
jgi:hypothetical protein